MNRLDRNDESGDVAERTIYGLYGAGVGLEKECRLAGEQVAGGESKPEQTGRPGGTATVFGRKRGRRDEQEPTRDNQQNGMGGQDSLEAPDIGERDDGVGLPVWMADHEAIRHDGRERIFLNNLPFEEVADGRIRHVLP